MCGFVLSQESSLPASSREKHFVVTDLDSRLHESQACESWQTNPNLNKAFSPFNLVATFKEK